jgi:hypothetical protein
MIGRAFKLIPGAINQVALLQFLSKSISVSEESRLHLSDFEQHEA